jgi:uncharacterized protein YsxB (DUF464 family)
LTKITFFRKNGVFWGFRETGHTGFGEEGDDILCSALSAMTMLILNTLEVVYKCPVDYRIDERTTDITVKCRSALPEYEKDLFTNKKAKTNDEVSKKMLEAVIPALEALSNWDQESIHDCLMGLAVSLEVKNATLMWPVRIAAAGMTVTPGGAVEICAILGREECLRRLKLGLEKLA